MFKGWAGKKGGFGKISPLAEDVTPIPSYIIHEHGTLRASQKTYTAKRLQDAWRVKEAKFMSSGETKTKKRTVTDANKKGEIPKTTEAGSSPKK